MKRILKFAAALMIFCSVAGYSQTETLTIPWPENEKWKAASDQDTEPVRMIEFISGKESLEKWTIIGTQLTLKGVKGIPMQTLMDLMFNQAKANAPEAQLTELERNETGDNPWILFTIESPNFIDDKNPESQLYYIMQGNQSTYSNFVAIKKKKLPNDFIEKWKAILKSSKLSQ
jgi:hypothetical protein